MSETMTDEDFAESNGEEPTGVGCLSLLLHQQVEQSGRTAKDLTVLADQNDPYRHIIQAQPYRIIFFGEKTSLKEILLPFVGRVNGELVLPTGESSDTLIAGVARRAEEDQRKHKELAVEHGFSEDTRQAVVLYFSDFDPAGHQMAISVARKLQALCHLLYPDLEIQLHPAALTRQQVKRLRLPSTPLKETEKRGDKWRAAMGYEQIEIDALIALNPEALREIVRDALEPFYDFTLRERNYEASREWSAEAKELVESLPEVSESEARIAAAYKNVQEALEEFDAVRQEEQEKLGFKEEKEWRVVYLKDRDTGKVFDRTFSYWVGPRGVEQKLKLKIEPLPGLFEDD
jgi:hypothetical protein